MINTSINPRLIFDHVICGSFKEFIKLILTINKTIIFTDDLNVKNFIISSITNIFNNQTNVQISNKHLLKMIHKCDIRPNQTIYSTIGVKSYKIFRSLKSINLFVI